MAPPAIRLVCLAFTLALLSPAAHGAAKILGDGGVENIMAEGLPQPKNSLACTAWSWALCSQFTKDQFKVGVNEAGGGGMQAPQHYVNGIFSLDMKLPAGHSGGTNFAWYLMDTISPSNKDPKHSELDMEFYGNQTSDTIMLALNVFAQGKQNLAQFRLPFDPAAALHNYAIKWGHNQIVWLVDNVPIRVLNKVAGQPWPSYAMQPMASVWATPWTPLKADFTNGPVFATYANYKALGCLAATPNSKQGAGCAGAWDTPLTAAQMAAYQKFHAANLIVDYGWDNI